MSVPDILEFSQNDEIGELAQALKARGFLVDVVNVPFKWYPVQDIVKQALMWRFAEVAESNGVPIDMVIPTKFPSYLVRHPLKVTWLFHQHREVYDLYGTPYCSFTDDPEEQEIRQTIMRMDAKTLRESRRIFTISKNVSARLERFNGIASEPLYPPPHYAGRYREGEFGDTFYVVLNGVFVVEVWNDDGARKTVIVTIEANKFTTVKVNFEDDTVETN